MVQTGRRPFVGRERERAALRARLDAARAGAGGVILLSGDAGIGKTRLLAELAAQAAADGRLVLWGRAYEGEGMPPYLPFLEAAREAARAHPTADRHPSPEARALGALLAGERSPDAQAGAGAQGPHALFQEVAAAFLALARAGLLLVLDDLHWADAASLRLLLHLARAAARGEPVLIAGAYRPATGDGADLLDGVIGDLAREGLVELLPLPALTQDDVAAYIERSVAGPVAPAVAAAIHRHTEGNPFFLGEVLDQLVADGVDLADPAAATAAWRVPDGVRRAIDRRLARLSAAALRVVQAGAVLGDGFSPHLLHVLCASAGVTAPADEEAVVLAIEEAQAAGILQERDRRYGFAHALIQQTVYQATSLARRERLHLHAARAIERVHARHLDPHLAALAAHYRAAGLAGVERALDYSIRAGEAAHLLHAFEQAAAHWQAALALLEQHGGAPEQRGVILERLCGALTASGVIWTLGADRIERMIGIYEELGQTERAAWVHVQSGSTYATAGPATDVARGMAHYRAAEALLGSPPNSLPHAHLRAEIAYARIFHLEPAAGLASAREAIALVERLDTGAPPPAGIRSPYLHPDTIRLRAAVPAGFHLAATGRLREGLAAIERAWGAANRLGLLFEALRASAWRGNISRLLCDPREARAWYERARDLPVAVQQSVYRSDLDRSLGWTLAATGDLAAARRLVTPHWEDPLPYWALDTEVAFLDGDWDGPAAAWERSLAHCRAGGDRYGHAFSALALGRLARLRGAYAPAATLLEEALALVAGRLLAIEIQCRVELALIFVEAGVVATARDHLDRCRAVLADGEDWRGLAGRVALAEAAVLGAERHLTVAGGAIGRAVETFQRFALPWDEAEARLVWGGAFLAAGERGHAATQFDLARALYARLGAGSPWPDRVTRAESRAPREGRRRRVYADGLTPREVEILRLIAEGASNTSIARDLVLSVRTVERHITNLYAKIGARSRADAVAYAFKHELAPTPTIT